jgi:uncharacterized protein (DUF1800 family)
VRLLLTFFSLLCLLIPVSADPWDAEAARHLLSRTTLFYTTEQLEDVTRSGPESYLALQLNPKQESNPYLELIEHRTMSPKAIYESLIDEPQATSIIEHEMIRGRLIQGLTTQYQLREVMTDFWFNHFNADPDKGPVVACNVARLENDLRNHAFGKFEDLLKIAVQNPAVLDNLDNTVSSGKAVNENLGREVMELYSTGPVHTQADVVEMARCLSGWSYDTDPESDTYLEFRYFPELHSPGVKTVLGQHFGEHEQEQALKFLAHHPATANYLSRKLVIRFVGDLPPQELVDRASATYLRTDGDISAVLRTILESPEFFETKYRNSKMKTSTEYVISALAHSCPDEALLTDLAENGEVSRQLIELVSAMGSPYSCPNPLGWPDKSSVWTSGSGQRQRWYLADLLSQREDLPELVMPELSDDTRTALQTSDQRTRHRNTLFSPEFQAR